MRGSLKMILLQLHEKVLRKSPLSILWSFSMWSKLERWKGSIRGFLMTWLQFKKKSLFWSVILHNNNEPFLSQIVSYVEKWILYDNRWQLAQWLNREEASKHFPKPNLHQKKVMITVWRSAACLIRYSFLNPSKTIVSEKYPQQTDDTYWKLQ